MNRILILLICMAVFIPVFGQVENKDKPSQGFKELKLKKVWEITEAGDTFFATISGFRYGYDQLYVVDRKKFKIHIYDSSGKYINSYGKKGEGPGELKYIPTMNFYKGKIFYMTRNKILWFNSNGTYLKTELVSKFKNLKKYSRFSVRDGKFFVKDHIRGKKITTRFLLYDRNTEKETVFDQFQYPSYGSGKTEGGISFGISVRGLELGVINYFDGIAIMASTIAIILKRKTYRVNWLVSLNWIGKWSN